MKNGDVQIMHLHRRVSHYRVVGDARLGASPISIYWTRKLIVRLRFDSQLELL
jgi:hypothetical protein